MQLESALALDGPPMRIKIFDISTIHGSYTVASMVVFTGGSPTRTNIVGSRSRRRSTRRTSFLSMQEVMSRRYAPERMADERFGSKPDLIILDGGKPQLAAVLAMFDGDGRRRHRRMRSGEARRGAVRSLAGFGPVVLPGGSASLYLVKQVRDEAHRFAIAFHRELRGKGMTASILDDVWGMGRIGGRRPSSSTSSRLRT